MKTNFKHFICFVMVLATLISVMPLGIAAAICNMVGGYIGAGLAMTKGSNLSRNCIIFVLFLLALKVMGVY